MHEVAIMASVYQAKYDFSSKSDGMLSFRSGDQFTVKNRTNDDWWTVEDRRGEMGLVPVTYIEPIPVSSLTSWWFFCFKVCMYLCSFSKGRSILTEVVAVWQKECLLLSTTSLGKTAVNLPSNRVTRCVPPSKLYLAQLCTYLNVCIHTSLHACIHVAANLHPWYDVMPPSGLAKEVCS